MSGRAAEEILKHLQWHKTPGGGLFAPIGPKRLKSLFEELEIPIRLPRYGYEMLLHKQGEGRDEAEFWVENSAGRFTVTAFGNWRKVIPELLARPDTKHRTPWRAF
jgi:hypothetical protein